MEREQINSNIKEMELILENVRNILKIEDATYLHKSPNCPLCNSKDNGSKYWSCGSYLENNKIVNMCKKINSLHSYVYYSSKEYIARYKDGEVFISDKWGEDFPHLTNKEKILHCEDSPALVKRGVSCWYIDGKLHREDGPATEIKIRGDRNQTRIKKEWYTHGVRHRVDGPAVENGFVYFYINGFSVPSEKFRAIMKLKRKSSLIPYLLDKDSGTRACAEWKSKELEKDD